MLNSPKQFRPAAAGVHPGAPGAQLPAQQCCAICRARTRRLCGQRCVYRDRGARESARRQAGGAPSFQNDTVTCVTVLGGAWAPGARQCGRSALWVPSPLPNGAHPPPASAGRAWPPVVPGYRHTKASPAVCVQRSQLACHACTRMPGAPLTSRAWSRHCLRIMPRAARAPARAVSTRQAWPGQAGVRDSSETADVPQKGSVRHGPAAGSCAKQPGLTTWWTRPRPTKPGLRGQPWTAATRARPAQSPPPYAPPTFKFHHTSHRAGRYILERGRLTRPSCRGCPAAWRTGDSPAGAAA